MKNFAWIKVLSIIVFILFSAPSFAQDNDYTIKPNDELKTYVFENPELSVSVSVPPDGIVGFPLAGDINVVGLSGEQLTKIITEKLSHYLINPKVNVFLTAYNPLKVYILGSVKTSGSYDYKPGQRLTDYLSEAGGFDQQVNMKKCYVYSAKEGEKAQVFDLKKLLENSKTELDIELKPYDTVYVKRKSGFMFMEWRDIADALNIVVGVLTMYYIIAQK